MSKKSFSGALDGLIGTPATAPTAERTTATTQLLTTKKGRGRPRTNFKENNTGTQKGTKPGEERATIILKQETIATLKAIAYWERRLVKDIYDEALAAYIEKYEKKAGQVKPIPAGR
jgi:hypothetical protein